MAREYKDSGIDWIGQIPKDWEVCRFKNFLSLFSIPSTSETKIGLENIESETGKFIKTEGKFEGNGTHFCKGDILYGKLRPYLKKVWLSTFEGNAVGDFFVFRVKDIACSNYIKWLLLSDGYTEAVNSSVYGAKMPRVSSEFIMTLPFYLPSFSEQQKIADYLDKVCGEVDEMVALQETMIEELKAYKQSVITEAVTKGLDPNVPMRNSGIDWIGEIPEHWEISKLKYYINVDSGDAITSEQISDKGLYPVYGGGEIMGYFSDYNITDDYLIVGRVGARCGCVTMPNKKCWATDNALVIKSDWYKQYLFYLLDGANLNRLNTSNAQPLITATKLKNVYVPIMGLEEQRTIASYLDTKCSEIDALIALKQAKIEELKEYKKSVIYEYVTGKKEVE